MTSPSLTLDTAFHPLADGHAPEWASGWGEDAFGPFVEFTLEEVTQKMRWCPPGRFLMGSPDDEPGRPTADESYRLNEGPPHEVYLSQGFWLFDTPVTQALWQVVMGENPSRFQSPTRPVEQVDWAQANAFCAKINERVQGLGLSLPTEAQWEYACRAGTTAATYAGPIEILGERNAPVLHEIAWYGGNSGLDFELEGGYDSSGWPEKQFEHDKAGTHPVGEKVPNEWGLHDMLGNVWEWCADGPRDYVEGYELDPAGPDGAVRVIRGGAWFSNARDVRAACRNLYEPDSRFRSLGFRCARVQA